MPSMAIISDSIDALIAARESGHIWGRRQAVRHRTLTPTRVYLSRPQVQILPSLPYARSMMPSDPGKSGANWGAGRLITDRALQMGP